MRTTLLFLTGCLFMTACSLGPNSQDWVQLKVVLPQKDETSSSLLPELGRFPEIMLTAPTTVDGFDCYAVNVYGQGIGTIPSSQACSYPGVTSTLATSNQTTLNLSVPAGAARTIQMIGVATGTGCDTTLNLQTYINSMAATPSAYSLALVGSSTTDLFASTNVNIQNAFVAGTTTNPFTCPGFNTVATGPTILPPLAGVTALGATNGSSVPVPLNAPPYFSGTTSTFNSSDLTLLTTASNSVIYGTTSTSIDRGSRLDLIYSLAAVDVTKFTSIKIDGIFGGTSFGGNGAILSVWDNVSQTWVADAALSNTSSSAINMTGTSTVTPARAATLGSVPITGYSSLTTPITLVAGGKHIFISINSLGHNISGPTQAIVKYIQVTLVP